ncbi:MAG: pyridoxamine 5'-phosphate oxidase family protein [Armatimonadetes bacterium]|nr:pyridoxamine 5'-phosphate oxidase family protein [Armatimonadota bacterium]
MATNYPEITPQIAEFIGKQEVFFVATAPAEGEINLSPKGLVGLHILNPSRVAFVDFPGSGNQTASHLRENGRITIMLCSFEGDAAIVRLFGRGKVLTCSQAREEGLAGILGSDLSDRARQVFVIDIDKAQKSCGFGVPYYAFQGNRKELTG